MWELETKLQRKWHAHATTYICMSHPMKAMAVLQGQQEMQTRFHAMYNANDVVHAAKS